MVQNHEPTFAVSLGLFRPCAVQLERDCRLGDQPSKPRQRAFLQSGPRGEILFELGLMERQDRTELETECEGLLGEDPVGPFRER